MAAPLSIDDPGIQARLAAAHSTDEAAVVLTDCGYPLHNARFVAAIMRGESKGDVVGPDADEPANP